MNEPRSTVHRRVRILPPRRGRILLCRPLRIAAAPVMAATLLAAAPVATAASSTAGPAPSETSLQTQAQELAGQIEADGQNLDRVAEALDAAQLRANQLSAQMTTLKASMARTSGQVTAARSALRQQAVLAYITGGAPIVDVVPGKAGDDPSLTVGYADVIAGGQQRALSAYRAVLSTQQQQSAALATATSQVTTTMAELRADQANASQVMNDRQQTLSRVKGQLAVLVTQVQRTQQLAEQKSLQASSSQHQDVPPPSRAVDPPAGPVRPAASTTTTAPAATVPSTTVYRSPTTIGTTPPTTAPPTTTTTVPPPPPGNQPARGWATAVHYAYAQLGKPYQWGGAGPNSFDCSGLTMMAWAAAGVYFPHLAQDQYDMTRHIPLSDVLPGDLIFFGTPNNVYHVGIYIGGGQMIDAPETGQDVSISSIYWTDLLGAGRIID